MANRSLEPIQLALVKVDENAGDFMALEVTVSRNNRPTPKTCYAGVERVPNPLQKEIKLIPIRDGGRPSRSTIVVNLVREMTCPGDYTVVIGLPITNRPGTEKSVARSRRITVSVVARPRPQGAGTQSALLPSRSKISASSADTPPYRY